MPRIKLDLEKYLEGLMVIENGFKNKNSQEYSDVKSNISSMLNMITVLQEINTTLDTYHAFLEKDIIKFQKVGENIYNTDKNIAQGLGG